MIMHYGPRNIVPKFGNVYKSNVTVCPFTKVAKNSNLPPLRVYPVVNLQLKGVSKGSNVRLVDKEYILTMGRSWFK